MSNKKIITGTKRPFIHCKICKTDYIDFCLKHSHSKDSWELRYD